MVILMKKKMSFKNKILFLAIIITFVPLLLSYLIFISSKLTDINGIVVFDSLSEGSYRVIEIVNRKYFEKPTYIQWNEVTISKDLKEESIIVINRIKKHSK